MFKAAGHGQFDKLLEKATSNLLLEPDWASIMQICDLIRQKDCQPKYALIAIKKKLYHTNPHVAMFGLQVLESIVKNCGSPVHDEVATKAFMEELRELAKTTQHENVREKILELIQTWAHAFRRLATYRAVQDVLNIMKAEGAKFPPLAESDAMFVSDTAPEWADSATCHRCRVEFGLMVRKHHCRACGQVFCGKCSNKTATLPKFGIEKEVRVCDACFEKVAKDGVGLEDPEELIVKTGIGQPNHQTSTQNKTSPPQRKKTDEELAEEEQLQLALAISQSEAEAKERESRYKPSGGMMSPLLNSSSGASEQDGKNQDKSGSPLKSTAPTMEPEDPELSRYLNRTYWENRHSQSKEEDPKEEKTGKTASTNSILLSGNKQTTVGSVPITSVSFSNFQPSAPVKENKQEVSGTRNFDNNQLHQPTGEVDGFVDSLRAQIETFVTRMKSNSSRGRLIANDTAVQSLFMNITALHSQLLNFIQAQDNARTYFEGLQDKLSQVRDARAALDALRDQHRERLRLKAEEEERAKRFHMAQMLQIKRQQKQEYLEYQRQLTLQRMQEQEREMQQRIEFQKQQLSQGQFGMYPAGMQGFMPQEMGHYMQPSHPGHFIPPPNMPMPPSSGVEQQQQQQPGMMRYPPGPNQFIPPPVSMAPMPQQGIPPHILQQQQQQQQQQQPGIPHVNSQKSIPLPVSHQGPPQQQQPMGQQMVQHPQQQYFASPPPPQQQQQQPNNMHPTNHLPQHGGPVPSNPPTNDVNSGVIQAPPPVKEEPTTAELISFD